jgi:hypothetical protein
MKRYNWEYNGENMGLFERENGIFVLHSDHIGGEWEEIDEDDEQ